MADFIPSRPAYSFAIETAIDGRRAVVVTEVRPVGGGWEDRRIVVPDTELAGFIGGLQAAAGAIEATARSGPAYSLNELREQHPRAYAPWTPGDDRRLVERHRQGTGVRDLAREFGRKPSAIRSRLIRLGVGQDNPPAGTAVERPPVRGGPAHPTRVESDCRSPAGGRHDHP